MTATILLDSNELSEEDVKDLTTMGVNVDRFEYGLVVPHYCVELTEQRVLDEATQGVISIKVIEPVHDTLNRLMSGATLEKWFYGTFRGNLVAVGVALNVY